MSINELQDEVIAEFSDFGSWYFCSMKKVRECTCVSNRFLLQ